MGLENLLRLKTEPRVVFTCFSNVAYTKLLGANMSAACLITFQYTMQLICVYLELAHITLLGAHMSAVFLITFQYTMQLICVYLLQQRCAH